jgi:hypothetical protein
MLDYGVAYRKDNLSPALANLLEIVDELATPLARELPAGYEFLKNASAEGSLDAAPRNDKQRAERL